MGGGTGLRLSTETCGPRRLRTLQSVTLHVNEIAEWKKKEFARGKAGVMGGLDYKPNLLKTI